MCRCVGRIVSICRSTGGSVNVEMRDVANLFLRCRYVCSCVCMCVNVNVVEKRDIGYHERLSIFRYVCGCVCMCVRM